jgi:hypothetical protein
MFSKYKIILAFFVVNMLAACGGGDSGSSSTPAPYVAPATYGAIAVGVYTQGSGYTGYGGSSVSYDRTSQAAANAAALANCNDLTTKFDCSVVFEFGANTCGAIARSVTTNSGVYGTASGSSGSLAEAAALSVCVRNGGTSCIIPTSTSPNSTYGTKLSRCNGTATAVTSNENNDEVRQELIDNNDPK